MTMLANMSARAAPLAETYLLWPPLVLTLRWESTLRLKTKQKYSCYNLRKPNPPLSAKHAEPFVALQMIWRCFTIILLAIKTTHATVIKRNITLSPIASSNWKRTITSASVKVSGQGMKLSSYPGTAYWIYWSDTGPRSNITRQKFPYIAWMPEMYTVPCKSICTSWTFPHFDMLKFKTCFYFYFMLQRKH